MYCRIYFLLFFLVHSYFIQAQETSTLVANDTKTFITTSDSIRDIKRLLTKTIKEEKDTLRTLAYHKLFLERGIKANDAKIQLYSAYRLGYYYNELADYENGAKYAQTSLQLSTTLKDTTSIIQSQILLGGIYFQLGIYDRSLESYQEAKALSKVTGNKALDPTYLANIGNIRVKLGRYQDALNAYTEALTLLKEEHYAKSPFYNRAHLSILLGKGKSQVDLGLLDEGIKTYQEGIELAKKYDLRFYDGEFYLNIGHAFLIKKQYWIAIDYLEKSKQLLSELYNDSYINILLANYYLAQCFYASEAYDEAMVLLKHNFEVIGTNYKTDKIVEMYDLGIKIAEIQEDKDQQLAFLNQSKLLSKLQLENQTKTRDLLFDNDVKTLEDNNKLLDIEKSKQERRKKIAISIAAALLILFIIMYVRYRRKIKSNEQKFKAIISELQEVKTTHNTIIETKNEDIAVKDHRAEEILEKLKDLEASNFFIEKECNLYNTAKLIDTNTTYLSKTLNTYKEQSFNQYLNELRIRYVLLQLKENSMFRAYTLKAISEEIGYKSINTFTKAFKTHTGLTPSYYIKQLMAEESR